MSNSLPKSVVKKLKSRAQLLEPVAKVGKAGISEAFVKSINQLLAQHELIKLQFDEFREQKKELAVDLAAKTGSELIWIIGHKVVLFRAKPVAENGNPLADTNLK